MTSRAARTTAAIREALHVLLEEKPFSDISVQDIAQRANINRATFYAHFSDKFMLLEDATREQYRERLARYDPFYVDDLSTLIESIAVETFEYLGVQNHAMVDKELEPQLERALQDALHEFLLPALDDASAIVVSSTVIGAAMQWRADGRKESPNDVAQRLVTVLSSGVRLLEPA